MIPGLSYSVVCVIQCFAVLARFGTVPAYDKRKDGRTLTDTYTATAYTALAWRRAVKRR